MLEKTMINPGIEESTSCEKYKEAKSSLLSS